MRAELANLLSLLNILRTVPLLRSLNIFPKLYFSQLHTILWYRGIRIYVTDSVSDPLAPPAPSLLPYLLSSILVERKSAEHSTGEEEGTGPFDSSCTFVKGLKINTADRTPQCCDTADSTD